MLYLFVAFGLLLHLLFWGAGLALLAGPRRWRGFWPVWMAPAGVALQSAVVWIGAHTTLAGTDAYAWWSELLPLALLCWGLRRAGAREAGRALGRFSGLWVVMAGCLVLLVLPLSRVTQTLTTASMGSCDAADYAAGARVFQEFASTDRSGFIGHSRVVSVGSTHNFFDFWIKLNHFTPSALIALNDTILGLRAYQLTGLLTLVLLVLVQPLVFWTARTMGLGWRAALWLTFIFGVSPVMWYAAYEVAPAQILAAMGIALATWSGTMMWRERHGRGWSQAGLLAVGFAIIWGGYNFIVVVCLAPVAACVGGWALAGGQWRELGRWAGRMLLVLGATGLFFYERMTGVVERFVLFQRADFGWKIPPLWPEGWLGFVRGAELKAVGAAEGMALATVILAAFAYACWRLWRRSPREGWRAAAYMLPVLAGYGILQWQGWHSGSNSSYDAYKLFSVFYPVFLAAFCPWLRWLGGRRGLAGAAIVLMVAVTLGSLHAMRRFAVKMSGTELVVTPMLAELQAVETYPQVHSVNMLLDDYWERIWANCFMLRRKQFFRTNTYEGRSWSDLQGEWNLRGGLVQVELPGGDSVRINRRYMLERVASPWRVRAEFGSGWHDREWLRGKRTTHWRWSDGHGSLVIDNPQGRPLRIVLHLSARSLVDRDLQVWIKGRHLRTVQVGTADHEVTVPPMTIPPGRVVLQFRSSQPPASAGGADHRKLGVAVYHAVVEVLAQKPDVVAQESDA
jgi:hypothetical protein